ncbi:glycosyltransferase [Mycobacterium gordonae]|nr:glycosyltransferase [Mycobacterium gordonae]
MCEGTGLAVTPKRISTNPPKLSVVTTTHNQEAFVRQAFESFVAQQIDFPMEIIVADDASTDATPTIIQEYADRYPDLFRPILRRKNLGLNRNLVDALSRARGTYIALCEGDDYWIDPLKLSKQVAFLDRHPGTTVCFHPVRVIWEDGPADDQEFPPVSWRQDLRLDALIKRNFIQTNSVMYRRLPHYRGIPADVMPLDHYLHVRHAFHGNIGMLSETMAVYRRHSQGMWNTRVLDPKKFWLLLGGGHAATYDAMIELAAGDPAREEVIGEMADWVFSEIGNVPGPEGRAALLRSIAQHPRCAMLALQHRWANDLHRLLSKVEGDPDDGRAVLHLAQRYFELGDFPNARKWYSRRVEMGGCDEEIYCAMYRLAESMANLGEPWPDVEDAYLKAWQIRPTRAEPLHAIAFRCRVEQRYKFAYLFAERAAKIPLPEEDRICVSADVYAWRATDEQAVCASWIGRHAEAFTLYRRLLTRPDLPEPDRKRIAANRDLLVPAMLEAAAPYPQALVQSLAAGPGEAEVTVSLLAGPDRQTTEQTLNSFLTCCLDVSRVGRFLVLDTGLSAPDRSRLRKRYAFLEFARRRSGDKPAAKLAQLRAQIHGRFWLHLGDGWRFFAPENLITRLTAVLDAEPQVFQVGINFEDAIKLSGASAAEEAVRRTPDAGRYLLTDVMASGPAMFDTARLDRARNVQHRELDPPAQRGRRATDTGQRTASLDEVLCISGPYL